jgi:hypothetical protein
MHTVMVVGGGLVALALFVVTGKLLGHPTGVGARYFIPVWLIAALVNLYLGTTHGYSIAGELPFFVIVFGVPALVAYAVMRWAG